MPKKTEFDYCLWKANCVILKLNTSLEGAEQRRCCYTCPKRERCEFACTDRDKAPHKCEFLTSKIDLEQSIRTPFPKVAANTTVKKSTKSHVEKLNGQLEDLKVEIAKGKKSTPKTQSRTSEPKNNQLPTTVKELAIQTGSTYARANYLIKTKKLTFEQAYKILITKRKVIFK